MTETIAEQVRRLRGALSQLALAESAELDQPQLAGVEGGKNVQLATLVRLARALGQPLVIYPGAPDPIIDRRPKPRPLPKKKKK